MPVRTMAVKNSPISTKNMKYETHCKALYMAESDLTLLKYIKVYTASDRPRKNAKKSDSHTVANISWLRPVSSRFGSSPLVTHSAVFKLGSCIPGLIARSWSWKKRSEVLTDLIQKITFKESYQKSHSPLFI